MHLFQAFMGVSTAKGGGYQPRCCYRQNQSRTYKNIKGYRNGSSCFVITRCADETAFQARSENVTRDYSGITHTAKGTS